MKGTLVVAVFGLFCCVSALPATSKEVDDTIEFVNPNNPYGDQPIVDTNVGIDQAPFSNPFVGLFDNLENLVVRMREQMNALLNRLPSFQYSNDSSIDIPNFPQIGFPPLDIDLSKGNTTSITKIVDGHKVVINQTEYQKDDELGSAFYKVRIIDVQPQEGSTERDAEEGVSTIQKDRESVESVNENEIFKNREAISYQPLENIDVMDSPAFFVPVEANAEWNDMNRIELIDDNSLNFQTVHDLSGDTHVNELAAKSGAPINPDAEIIGVVPQRRMERLQYS